jgi:hypothetical protein
MDWMGLEKILKKFDLFGIQTHPIPLNPHGLRANRTSPNSFCRESTILSSAGGETEKLGEEQERYKFLGLNQLDYTLNVFV